MKLYKYQKVTDQYTTYTVNTYDRNIIDLGIVNGDTYFIIPEEVTLPELQPEEISASIVYIGNNYDEEILLNNFDISKNLELDGKRSVIATTLNQAIGYYINKYYDAGTQQTFQSMLQMDTVPDEVKTLIKTIYPWIQLCLVYYYNKKVEVLTSDIPEIVTWDFVQFDTSKPDVSLGALMSG
jgi:hypothetical protein